MSYEQWFKKYPRAFDNHGLYFYPEHSSGWNMLLEDLLQQIERHLAANPLLPFQIEQIKEKFGSLRFYISGGDDKIYDLINEAERKSSVTCELCGSPGSLRKNASRWLQTLCPECEKKHGNNRTDRGTGEDTGQADLGPTPT